MDSLWRNNIIHSNMLTQHPTCENTLMHVTVYLDNISASKSSIWKNQCEGTKNPAWPVPLCLFPGEDRGPVLEVIVSRTNFISSHTSKSVRVVGLSTALANARDLADWLGIGQVRCLAVLLCSRKHQLKTLWVWLLPSDLCSLIRRRDHL